VKGDRCWVLGAGWVGKNIISSIIDNRQPTTNYQLPTTNYQLSITNYQLPTIYYQL